MKGIFEYVNADYKHDVVDDSTLIPDTARELILFKVEPPPPPHTPQQHEEIAGIQTEFDRVFKMIYKRPRGT